MKVWLMVEKLLIFTHCVKQNTDLDQNKKTELYQQESNVDQQIKG